MRSGRREDARDARRLWTTEDVARYIGHTRRYAAKLCNDGTIYAVRVGGSWRTTKEAVDRSLGIEAKEGR